MKNLVPYTQRVHKAFEQNDFELARQICHEMIDYSDAKPETKRKHHFALDHKPDRLLQFWAEDYRLAGEGLKVIK
jgi:hypothetical protein